MAADWTNLRVTRGLAERVAAAAALEDRSARSWAERALEAALESKESDGPSGGSASRAASASPRASVRRGPAPTRAQVAVEEGKRVVAEERVRRAELGVPGVVRASELKRAEGLPKIAPRHWGGS